MNLSTNFFIISLVPVLLLFSCKNEEGVTPQDDTENKNPTASTDEITLKVEENKTIEVLANDTDPENDPLIVKEVSPLDGFTFNIDVNGIVSIVSASNKATGNYETTYTIEDSEGNTATGTIKITLNKKPVTYENIIKYGSSTYTPDNGGWLQAGIYGYHRALIKSGASTIYEQVVVHISSQFDYSQVGKTYTLTTTTVQEDVPEGKAYVHFYDSFSGSGASVVNSGQTIKLKNISNHTTGIKAYIVGENLNTSGGKTLTFKAVR